MMISLTISMHLVFSPGKFIHLSPFHLENFALQILHFTLNIVKIVRILQIYKTVINDNDKLLMKYEDFVLIA